MDGTYLFFSLVFHTCAALLISGQNQCSTAQNAILSPQNLFRMLQFGINVLHKLLTVLTNSKQLIAGQNLTGLCKNFFLTPIENAYSTTTLLSQSWTYTNTKKYCHNRA